MKNFSEIISFLKNRFFLESDAQVAKLLNISPQNLHHKISDDSVPFKALIQLSEIKEISLDEIFLGKTSDKTDINLGNKLINSLLFLQNNHPDIFKTICIEIFGRVEWLKTQQNEGFNETTDIQRQKTIHALIYFLHNTKYCGITKLMKLLYFLDFILFRETAESLTGLSYYAWQSGPVPESLYKELKSENKPDDIIKAFEVSDNKDKSFIKIMPIKDFDPTLFSKRELNLLEKISLFYRDTKAEEIVEKTHLSKSPWLKTIEKHGKDKVIDYMLAVDGKHGLPKWEIVQRLEELSRK